MTPVPKTRPPRPPRATKRRVASKPRAVAAPADRGGTSPIKRRRFTEAEKKDAAQLGREIGAKEAAKQLDVARSVMYGWMKQFPAGSSFSSAS